MNRASLSAHARRTKSRALAGARRVRSVVIRVIDVAISATAMIYLIPAFLIIAAFIYFEDRGPVFFVQTRIGRNGKHFACYKFRTMCSDGDHIFQTYLDGYPEEAERWAIYRKLDHDPRVTKVGRFLRKTSLDEFPQLINVLKGEMSLVGPRPIMEDELEKYGASFRVYSTQMPGITGLWQIMGRNRLSYLKRVALDRVLARKLSVRLYLGILWMTVPAVLLQQGVK